MGKRPLHIMIALLVLLSVWTGKAVMGLAQEDAMRVVVSPSAATVVPVQDRQRSVATLSDRYGSFRLCNTRPQRILPVHGAKPGKTLGRSLAGTYHSHSRIFKPLYYGHGRLETAPFCSAASCDYYVIALRHIIR